MSDWNYFRGNPQQTASQETGGPQRGVISWRKQLGRQWYSSPLIDGNKLFCACPGRLGRKLICIDRRDGSLVWEVFGKRNPKVGFNVLESCTALSNDTAYVYCEDGYLYRIE